MLPGVRTAINTVIFATPYLGTGIVFIVATTPMRGAPIVSRAIGGALSGAMISTGWEFTVNRADPPEIKAEVILGSSAIGAGAAAVAPMLLP